MREFKEEMKELLGKNEVGMREFKAEMREFKEEMKELLGKNEVGMREFKVEMREFKSDLVRILEKHEKSVTERIDDKVNSMKWFVGIGLGILGLTVGLVSLLMKLFV